MQEVSARGGQIILISNETETLQELPEGTIKISLPAANAFVNPMLYAIPVQLLAYHAAVFMGTDVDQPRNLAKSVTVE